MYSTMPHKYLVLSELDLDEETLRKWLTDKGCTIIQLEIKPKRIAVVYVEHETWEDVERAARGMLSDHPGIIGCHITRDKGPEG